MQSLRLSWLAVCVLLLSWSSEKMFNVVNAAEYTSGIIKCPGRCEFSPCACCEENLEDRCDLCHANGCDKCQDTHVLFKVNHNYYCEYCEDIFGTACMLCQDGNGCGQCEGGYTETEDTVTGLVYCKPDDADEAYTLLDCGEIDDTHYDDHTNEYGICDATTTWTPRSTLSTSAGGVPTRATTDRPSDSPTDRPTDRPSGSPTDRPTDIVTTTGASTTDTATTGVATTGVTTTGMTTGQRTTGASTECDQKPTCPFACDDDPCECDDVEFCQSDKCESSGCDQCVAGYFKKDYNYPCQSCTGTFGSDCEHCTDFLGCQQCSQGERVYDQQCGLYYCRDAACGGSSGGTTTTGIGGGGGGGAGGPGTPSPSRSPTEEPTQASVDCEDGYAVISDVSPPALASLEGAYYALNLTWFEHPVFSKNGWAPSTQELGAAFAVSDGTDALLLDVDTMTVLYVAGATNLNQMVGEDVALTVYGGQSNASVDATIELFDCDGEAVTLSDDSCDADCIVVSAFEIDGDAGDEMDSSLGDVGGRGALNGEYCYDDDCSCYLREVLSGTDYVHLMADDSTGVISFSYQMTHESDTMNIFSVQYSEAYDGSLYDEDFACQDVIDAFFVAAGDDGGSWDISSAVLELSENPQSVSNGPSIAFWDCLGVDFYCPIDESGSKGMATLIALAPLIGQMMIVICAVMY